MQKYLELVNLRPNVRHLTKNPVKSTIGFGFVLQKYNIPAALYHLNIFYILFI